MASIQFGGLASGMETNKIVEQLMELERQPIKRLEKDKETLNNRLTAFNELEDKLKSFADAIKDLNFSSTLKKHSVTRSSESFLSASVDQSAIAGASYQVEVVSLAQVQKSISEGFASKTDPVFGTGNLNLTVDGTTHTIAITAENNSLEGIVQAINEAGLGVSAGIINDGNADTPFRLSLTGKEVSKAFSLDSSGLTDGTASLGQFNEKDGNGTIINPPIQEARQAHIRVDTVDIYSTTNTIQEAIPGMSLDLLKAEPGSTTSLKVDLDKSSIQSAIEAFATGYNEVVSFITGQSVINGAGGGVLGGDAGMNSIKRHMQSMLTQTVKNSGSFSTLSQLGFRTQKDGTLTVDSKALSKAIETNLDSVVSLMSGEEGVDGIITQYKDYLFTATRSSDGILASRKEGINNNIKRIDDNIKQTETRITKRQASLEAQFTAMESLIAKMNSQSSFLERFNSQSNKS
ncbi:MAG: flagellar filament capping protein FliD [Desulfobulbus sp.]|jgi:flagellar hook-associated protein 2